MKGQNLVVGIYYHPEAYPPTLNAITELSGCFNSISLLYRPHLKGSWVYPSNVKEYPSGKMMSAREQEQASFVKKLFLFIGFAIRLLKIGVKQKPAVFLLYDIMALYAFYLVRPFFRFRHKVWYHNHDVAEMDALRKFSISWFAAKAEKKHFNKLDLFSLPTEERLRFFDIASMNGKHFTVANYPSLNFYNKFYQGSRPVVSPVKILFQGRIGEGHGLEMMISTIGKFHCVDWKLILKGYCDEGYKQKLVSLATAAGVKDQLEFHGFTEYSAVPKLASECHIGIAIFQKQDIMNKTLGTASNKIYEYAALGLPVIYDQNSSIAETLSQFDWAIGVTLSEESVYNSINGILANYAHLSHSARSCFLKNLNFEGQFGNVKQYLINELA